MQRSISGGRRPSETPPRKMECQGALPGGSNVGGLAAPLADMAGALDHSDTKPPTGIPRGKSTLRSLRLCSFTRRGRAGTTSSTGASPSGLRLPPARRPLVRWRRNPISSSHQLTPATLSVMYHFDPIGEGARFTPHLCHSERSEESNWIVLMLSRWILRFAQNDRMSAGFKLRHYHAVAGVDFCVNHAMHETN